MTFTASLTALCDDLASIYEGGTGLVREELPSALVARDAILAAVADPYRDLAGVSNTAVRRASLDAAAEHPVALLRFMLDRAPAGFPAQRQSPPETLAGRTWASAGNNASLLQQAWRNTDPETWPTGAEKWTVLADLSAVIEAVTLLDRHIVPDASESAALPSGLGVAAREVRRLSLAGELPSLAEPRTLPSRPVRVRSLEDLAGAQVRLATLLRRAEHLDPAAMRQVTLAHRQTVGVITWAMGRLASDERSSALYTAFASHAGLLTLSRDRGVASILPGDERPRAQALEIAGFTERLHGRGRITRGDQPAVLAAARSALHVSETLGQTAEAHLGAGRWLMPDGNSVALIWVRADLQGEPPRTVAILRAAQDHAKQLASLPGLPTPAPPPTMNGPASIRLAASMATRVRRPLDPARRPGQVHAI